MSKRNLPKDTVQDTVKKHRGVWFSSDVIVGIEREGSLTKSSEQGQELDNMSEKNEK